MVGAAGIADKRLDPRARRSREQILGAAMAIIREVGMANLTLDAVIERAEVARTTLYRHWTGRDQLLSDAVDAINSSVSIPDTGDVRRDLMELVFGRTQTLRRGVVDFEGLLSSLAASSKTGTLLAQLEHRRSLHRHGELVQILVRAQDRGQIRADIVVDTAAKMLLGGFFNHVILMKQPLTQAFVTEMIDVLVGDGGPDAKGRTA